MNQNGRLRNYANGIAKFLRLLKKQNLAIQNDGTFPTSFYDQKEILHDRQIITSEEASIYRRTLLLERDPMNCFGFSLQSIVIEKKYDDDSGKRITYVSRVDDNSPADLARMVP
uniref:Uncharacterized protein n=1 Tax=Panagrolaimus sp. JU765 TaxID=591449 RepID=A0AC34PVI7_9BILA